MRTMQHKVPAAAWQRAVAWSRALRSPHPTTHTHKHMKLHLPTGLRSAIMAGFALVSGVSAPPVTATLAGSAAAAVFICSAAPAQAEDVTWDANWNVTNAPATIPDENVLSALPSGFTFLSSASESYLADGQTVVRLNGTLPAATDVEVIGGAGATSGSTSESEGPLKANTWLKVTGGTYATIAGGSYAQNYDGGTPVSFTGDSHILLTSEGGNSPTVDYIVGGNYMDAQNAPFTGNSYISVQNGAVNGSIVGGGTSAHIRTAVFNGNSSIWVYTPLASSAAQRAEFPGNFIVGGNAAINNYAPALEQTGNSSVTIDLSAYTPSGSASSMEKTIVGDAWLLGNTTSTHTGNVGVDIKGVDAASTNVRFAQPIVAGSWFAGSGKGNLSGTTLLNISGGTFAGPVVGGSWLSAGDGVATQQTGNISVTVNGGEVNGNIYGGSYSQNNNSASLASHGDISLSLTGGTISGNVFAGGGLAMVGDTPAAARSAIRAASTQVEIADSVVLGSSEGEIAISGGVENANAASGITGNRTLLFSGSNYANLGNAIFYDFNIVNTASDVTLKLKEIDDAFSKTGSGTLTLDGVNSNLDTIASLTVEQGRLDTGTAWLTRNHQGLTSITVGEGASLETDGLTLVNGAALSLNVANPGAGALITVDGTLTVGGEKALALTLLGVDSLAGGSSVNLLSWSNAEAPFELADVTWVNKGEGMEAYTLSLGRGNLMLTRAEALAWAGGNGTWSSAGSEWDSQSGVTSDGKAITFNTPTEAETTVTISGAVAPQSIVVDNDASAAYTFASDGTGSITGASTLTKENEGTLTVALENTYTGGTTVNGGTVDAAAVDALGTGAVTVNEEGTLRASVANAVAGNALNFNGGSLSYTADETRSLDTAAITHTADATPEVSVAADNTVTWQYTDGAALNAAMVNGLALSGGGTMQLNAADAAATAALVGPVSLTDAGTTLEIGTLGTKALGAVDAPMVVTLGEGTTLRVQQPEAAAATTIHAKLEGNGTLEIAAGNANASNTVQLMGNNAGFAGSVNLGEPPAVTPIALAVDGPAVLLDYSQGSPVGATLNLNGLSFATVLTGGSTTETAAAINLNANTTQYAQTAGLNNTFSGVVSAAAGTTWELNANPVDGGQTNTLSGNLSAMQGTLSASGKEGSLARWVLGGAGSLANPEIAATLDGVNAFNEFVFDYADEVTLSGSVTGAANLTQQGGGRLVLTGTNTSSGTLRIAEGGIVQLGDAMQAGQWGVAAGSELAGSGTFLLSHGTLAGPLTLATGSTPQVAVNVNAGNRVDFGGNEGSLISGGVTLAEGATLTNVGTSILEQELNFTLGTANIGTGTAAADSMVRFVDTPVTLRAVTASLGSETAAINLDTSTAGVVELLRQHRVDETESYLTLTNGTLVTAADYSNVSFGQNMDILRDLGLRIERVDGGSLVLSGTAQGVYIAGDGEDATAATGYQNFAAYQAVAVMPGERLTLTLDGAPDAATEGDGATINNLLGAEDSAFVVQNTSTTGEQAVVILNNSVQAIDPLPEGLPGDPVGANTTFGGSIGETEDGGDVTFIKRGAGTLTVGGEFDAHQLTVQEGSIVLNGDENGMDALAVDGGTAELGSGTFTTVDSLEDGTNGGTIRTGDRAILVTTGTSTLESAQLEGPGALVVAGELALADDARLNGVLLAVDEGSTVTLDATNTHSVSALSGRGTLAGTGTAAENGLTVTGEDGRFAGTLAGNGTLTVAEGARQLFGRGFAGGSGWNLTNNGRMGLDFVAADGSNAPLALDALALGTASVTDMNLNTDAPVENLLTLGSISVDPTARVNLSAAGAENIVRQDTSYVLGTVSGGQPAGELATVTPELDGLTFMLLDAERSTLSVDDAGNLRLNLVTSRTNNLAPLAGNSNSNAGAELLWNAAFDGNTAVGTDIRRLLMALNNPANAGDADRLLAAASGASTTVLSSAFAADVERQLRAVRNRTTMLTGSPRPVARKGAPAACGPRVAAWISGEGDHRKMDAAGYMPGYSLSSWGGTVGMDMCCSDHLVGGLALTAMYGDLKAHSADHAKGDFDRYYISAFARMKQERWQHTLVGTVGRLDGDFDRSVYFGEDSYRTHGNTKGWGYGLMYEIGYDIPMDEDARFTLQPVANVAWRYVDVDGYTERGSDAALHVGGQDYHVVTFGAGLRTQAEVGESWFNRRALFEGRALVKVDAGDRDGEAMVAMLGGGGRGEKVRSEKLGTVGVELGAGLSIPLGDNHSSLFIDGSAELRNEYSNLNGSIGYRFEF